MPDIAIEFDNVRAGYKDFMILNDLSFKAKKGAITLLLGPNGAGKSTVLKTLFGLLKVRQGRILLEGIDITGATSRQLLDDPMPQARLLAEEEGAPITHRAEANGLVTVLKYGGPSLRYLLGGNSRRAVLRRADKVRYKSTMWRFFHEEKTYRCLQPGRLLGRGTGAVQRHAVWRCGPILRLHPQQ